MMFICFDLEFTRDMQGGTAPRGKETLLNPEGGRLN